jgi:ribosomal protein S27AE
MTLNKDKTYNKERGCPKCGSQSSLDGYDDAINEIRRTCNNCRFSWFEEPLDK